MSAIPSGTVTFLFTDIEGSTHLWEYSPEHMKLAFARQEAILRQVMAEHGGYVYKMIGDAFQVAFETALSALSAALEAQRRLLVEDWGGAPIRVRMALHSGVTEERGDDYVGPVLNRLARLLSASYGGQILLTQATYELIIDGLPDGAELRDLGEHRLKDLARPERIYQIRTRELPDDFPPIKTIGDFPNNLPIQRTSFIGREAEIERIRHILTSNWSGLVTLVGPGGTGKTRLALQAVVGMRESFPDGIWLVELALLADPVRVTTAVALALGVRETSGKPVITILLEHIRSKRLLLILDNCEHLVDACAALAVGLLRECPGLCILATSRELLGAAGEIPFRVPPLAVPGSRQPTTLDSLPNYDAVRLFIERAMTVSPSFTLTASNAPYIIQICQRLDGIPLALELAAARTRLLSAEQIAAHLDDAFRLLTGGSRTALPRQQTLRALIDWSYNLLSTEERQLLAQLSVFAGGWTLEAAEEVGHAFDIFDTLGKLVDKSLVVAEPVEGTETRYRMLETIRQYAGEKLHEMCIGKEARDRHLGYFLRLAEQAEPHLRCEEGAAWMDRLEQDLDNLRQALEWSLVGGPLSNEHKVGRVEAGLRLAGALMWFWHIRSHWRESVELLERLLEKEEGSSQARANALQTAGFLSIYNLQSNYEDARAMMEESIAIFRNLGPAGRHELAVSLVLLGGQLADRERGQAMVAGGLEIFREEQDPFYTAEGLFYLGAILDEQGNHNAARNYYEESLALRRQIQDQDGMGICLLFLGQASFYQGDYAPAARLLEESAECFQQAGNQARLSRVYNVLSRLALARGDYKQAAQNAEQALAISQEINDQGESVRALNICGMLAWGDGNYPRATAYARESFSIAQKIGSDPGGTFAQYILGRVALTQGDIDGSASLFNRLLSETSLSLDSSVITRMLDSLAGVASARGQMERAATIFGAIDARYRQRVASISPIERSEHDVWLSVVRQNLDEPVFLSAWVEGQALTLVQAIALALENERNSPSK